MSRARILSALVVLAVLAFTPAAFAQDDTPTTGLTGDWALEMEGPQGLVNMTIQMVQTDAALAGTLDGPFGEIEIAGEVAEGEVSFWVSVDSPQGTFELVFYGTVEENKKMSGTMEAGGGEFTTSFVAERIEKQ